MKTNKGLVDYVKLALAEKWVYWYGTTGKPCTEDLLRRKAAQYPEHYTDKRMDTYRKHIAEGRWCADCINLVKGYMWLNEETGRQSYASNNCPDTNADGMYSRATVKGPIANMPELPGIILHLKGHAGVYIGNGEVIEARGFAYGVVKTKLESRPWLHWYQMPGMVYDEPRPVEQPKDADDVKVVGDEVCPYDEPTKNVRYHDKGRDVRWVQWHLSELGYDLGKCGIDGEYGKKTWEAVNAFQNVMMLTTDNVVGPQTRAALKDALDRPERIRDGGCPYPLPKYAIRYGQKKSDDVRWLQWHLYKLGYDIGPDGVDGDFGPCTHDGLELFQREHDLVPEDVVNRDCRDELVTAITEAMSSGV